MDEFDNLSIWRRGDQRAPHKPLLLLIALSRQIRGDSLPVSFSEVEPLLRKLLIEFGPTRKNYHPEYPFWHLQQDGLWIVKSKQPISLRKGSSNPSKTELIAKGAVGSLAPAIIAEFKIHPEMAMVQAKKLLDDHFPSSLHSDIGDALGISLESSSTPKRLRDPRFRAEVLVAYEYRCAVCGLDMRIGSVTVGIEAAHIKWHQAGGPDSPSNGLALCCLHHKLLDLGAYTVLKDRRVIVSEHVHGGQGFENSLLVHHGKTLRKPQRLEQLPSPAYLDWHRREVFKEGGRELA